MDLGREDFGTDSTVLMAAFNRSNGVCGVGMIGIIPLSSPVVYNDPLSKSVKVIG